MAISRRTFVAQGTIAGAGLLIGVRFSGVKTFAQENEKAQKKPAVNPFDAYIQVRPDGKISLIVAKSEMGQGIKTGLAMILAEEADVDFSSVSVEQAETRPDIYPHMGTGGSGSTMENFMPLRRAGATVRELMITAAAQKWNVPKQECAAKKGAVLHEKSTRQASYGELVEAAMKLPLPDPEKVRNHWAFKPIQHPTAPEVKNKRWVKNPIDAFVIAKLEARDMTPSRQVEKRILIRRAIRDIGFRAFWLIRMVFGQSISRSWMASRRCGLLLRNLSPRSARLRWPAVTRTSSGSAPASRGSSATAT